MKKCPFCAQEIPEEKEICPYCARDTVNIPAPLPPPSRVTLVDIDLPFGSMVVFLVKWALAAIPAILILGAIGFFIALVFAALGMALPT